MIENTFLFLPGVGPKTEQKLWQQGVRNWNDFLAAGNVKGIGRVKKVMADKLIMKARTALREGNEHFFRYWLPQSEHWRLYEHFRDEAVFLDIETCGGYGYITVIGLYDGYEVKHMVRGANLYKEALQRELEKYKLIVTFNGTSFDVPVINRYFRNVVPDIPHLDLRHACTRIGLTGGLKVIEKKLGLRRGASVDGLCGGDAVMLWDRFRITEEEKYLKQLLTYNAEDIINLKPLAEYAYANLRQMLQISE